MSTVRIPVLAALLLSVFASGVAHAGVGVTPPYVRSDVLLPGSRYEQQINAVASGHTSDLWVHPVIVAPAELEGWLSFDPVPPFRIPVGENKAPFKVIVEVPPDAPLGQRTGDIYLKFNTNPDVVSGGGAVVDVALTVTDVPVTNLRIRRLTSLPDTPSRLPVRLCMDVENSGNTAGTFDRVELDVLTYTNALRGSGATTVVGPDIPPFTVARTCAEVPLDPPVSPGSYKARFRVFEDGAQKLSTEMSLRIVANPNHAPVAIAGEDQLIEVGSGEGAAVTLDGSGSLDADSSPGTSDAIVAYAWFYGGQPIADTAIADVVLTAGEHRFTLVVTDDVGESASDEVVVTVLSNSPPVADAGPDVDVYAGPNDLAVVTLDGSGSSDADSTPGTADDVVAYVWSVDGEAIASGAVAAPTLPPGEYTVALTVTDRFGASDSDITRVVVRFDTPPVAAAGPDQWVIIGDDDLGAVDLDGAASADPDAGDAIVDFAWFLAGERVATGPSASLRLPVGEHAFTLIVTDRYGKTGVDDVVVLVTPPPNDPPVALAEVAPETAVGADCLATVDLDGSGSSDPNSTPGTADDIVDYAWFVDGEQQAGGVAATVLLPPGSYEVTLVVTDAAGEQAVDVVEIDVVDATPPSVTVSVAVGVLWPPTRQMLDPGFAFAVADNCDAAPELTLSATSDEPSGKRGPAAVFDAAGAVTLRAERDGKGDGRVYVLGVSAVDADGNAASAQVPVDVPHREKDPAVDSGQAFDATATD